MKNGNISERVIRYVMTVTDEEFSSLSVGVLAHSLNVDRTKLTRQFKRKHRITLKEFLFKEKMNRASFLLKAHLDITVREVSEKIGYCNSDYFIRKFRQHFGIAPGMYKELKKLSPRGRKQGSRKNSGDARC